MCQAPPARPVRSRLLSRERASPGADSSSAEDWSRRCETRQGCVQGLRPGTTPAAQRESCLLRARATGARPAHPPAASPSCNRHSDPRTGRLAPGRGRVTGAARPFLGGWLVHVTSWRWVFLVNLPLASSSSLPVTCTSRGARPPHHTSARHKRACYPRPSVILRRGSCARPAGDRAGGRLASRHRLRGVHGPTRSR
jgi:hypothetical protein